MVMREFDRGLDALGMGSSPAPRQQESEAAANTELPPECRKLWAKWQGFAHGAFATTTATDDCVMNGTQDLRGTKQQAIASLRKTCAQSGKRCEVIAAK
jgi:hypothetical protein